MDSSNKQDIYFENGRWYFQKNEKAVFISIQVWVDTSMKYAFVTIYSNILVIPILSKHNI